MSLPRYLKITILITMLSFATIMLGFLGFFGPKEGSVKSYVQNKEQNMEKTIYQFTMNDIDGKPVSLADYKGKIVLIVNVASKCGYTPQYEGLEKFYKENKDKGIVIIGFPANNFLSQEPGTDSDIKSFCSKNYGVTFPIFSKISVKGKDMAPLYKFLTSKDENGVMDSGVKWNFQKYLIDREGRLVTFFDPGTLVTDKTVTDAIAAIK